MTKQSLDQLAERAAAGVLSQFMPHPYSDEQDRLRRHIIAKVMQALEAATEKLRERLAQRELLITRQAEALAKKCAEVDDAREQLEAQREQHERRVQEIDDSRALAEKNLAAAEAQLATLERFVPDSAHINALPEPLRRFIHDLETRCDPAGDVRALAVAKDTIASLELRWSTLTARITEVLQKERATPYNWPATRAVESIAELIGDVPDEPQTRRRKAQKGSATL